MEVEVAQRKIAELFFLQKFLFYKKTCSCVSFFTRTNLVLMFLVLQKKKLVLMFLVLQEQLLFLCICCCECKSCTLFKKPIKHKRGRPKKTGQCEVVRGRISQQRKFIFVFHDVVCSREPKLNFLASMIL